MGVFKLITCTLLVIGAVSCQEYQEYDNSPRSAPARLRPGNGPVEPRPTPVPILKQINRHNEDGSYTYGYEGADGSFKIETKLATGEVKGKYGYVDETGKVRVVEYGANKYGFQPAGEGITVAPPTLVDESTNKDGTQILDYEDEPRQAPPQKPYIARVARPQAARPQPRPQYIEYEDEPAPRPQYAPAPRPKYVQAPEPVRPQYSQAPAPPRLQIPGAQPTGDIIYSPQPRPARPDPEYSQSQTFAAPQLQSAPVRISRPSFAPAPEPAPLARAQAFGPPARPVHEPLSFSAPRPVPQQYSAPQGRSGGVLDQLAKDYALPQGGAQPLHDISFGYY